MSQGVLDAPFNKGVALRMRLRRPIGLISGFVLFRCACTALAAGIPSRVAGQGTVSGRVVLIEKPGQKTNDLDNAVIWLEPTSGAASRPRPTKVEVAMRARQFAPHVRVVSAGSTVSFPNQDPFSHNTFSSTPGSSFDLGLYGRGQSRDQVFTKAGPTPVYCNIHSRMAAFVVVVTTPWFAQTGADGRWAIPGVPPGTYTMHIWHERAPKQTRELTVAAGGVAGVEAQMDARGFVLVEHKDKYGKDYTGPGQIKY
jgi:plastocyanin